MKKIFIVIISFASVAIHAQLPVITIDADRSAAKILHNKESIQPLFPSSFSMYPSIQPVGYQLIEPASHKLQVSNVYKSYYNYSTRGMLRCGIQEVAVILESIPAYIGDNGYMIHEDKKAHQDVLPFSHRNYENDVTHNNDYLLSIYQVSWTLGYLYR